MKDNEISSGNVEIESSIINDSDKGKEEFHSKQLLSTDYDTINNSENNNIELTDDDSNSLLMNNSIKKVENKIYGLRLYLNPNKCFQLFKTTKMGKSYACFYNENDDPLIIIGPQWPFCLILLSITTFIFIFIYLYYNNKSITFIKIIDWGIFCIWLLSYISMCIKNPGYPKMCSEAIRGTKQMSYCDKCEIWYKPSSSTVHCEICDICIEGYTHHCLWAGHCIGTNNKKDFYIFLVISILFPMYLIGNIVIFGKN